MCRAISGLVFLIALSVAAAAPLVVAHRGASAGAPENTLPAFELAWAHGADAIEGDFHLTADGKIVCIHDDDTEYAAGVKCVVRKSTLTELLELDVGARVGERFNGTRIPTIAQVFATVPAGKKIFIEIKCGSEIFPRLLSEIEKFELSADQIVVISFDANVIRDFKAIAPQFKAMWLSGIKKNRLGRMKPSLSKVLRTLRRIDADGFSSRGHALVDQRFIAAIREAGFEYHVWTIDDANTARTFAGMGAMSITTNYPQRIKDALQDR